MTRRRTVADRLPMQLRHVAPVRHVDSADELLRRRHVVSGALGIGTAALGVSLSSEPGSRRFYLSTLGVAGIWTAGALTSGPLHRGWVQARDLRLGRPVWTPVATGVGAFGFFVAVASVATRAPRLHRAVADILSFAERGNEGWVLATTLANGVSEEMFFRGALYTALEGRRPAVTSTLTYAAVTASTRNPALVAAATVMGGLFAVQRRATGGLQAPLLTHLTWSALMVRCFPRIYRWLVARR
ncbi:MAG TPA: type II CAAX endopeptidase family protein [Actinomycetales bacterium]|nr:type II CAAX endopeptidase family protein [Actinomycetales bacterium]